MTTRGTEMPARTHSLKQCPSLVTHNSESMLRKPFSDTRITRAACYAKRMSFQGVRGDKIQGCSRCPERHGQQVPHLVLSAAHKAFKLCSLSSSSAGFSLSNSSFSESSCSAGCESVSDIRGTQKCTAQSCVFASCVDSHALWHTRTKMTDCNENDASVICKTARHTGTLWRAGFRGTPWCLWIYNGNLNLSTLAHESLLVFEMSFLLADRLCADPCAQMKVSPPSAVACAPKPQKPAHV